MHTEQCLVKSSNTTQLPKEERFINAHLTFIIQVHTTRVST